jgi:endonuclease/exonuclease/phosphatase family metal-dependent hydrolase
MFNKLIFAFIFATCLFCWYTWRPYQTLWLRFIPNSTTFNISSLTATLVPIKIIQFNVDHGGESRIDAILEWLRVQNADIVGFCEANKWQYNLTNIAFAAGYSYSKIFPTQHGYPLAVFSKTPIEVIGCHQKHFERGVLHVKILGVHFFIVHLNAHSAASRELETLYLSGLIRKLEVKNVNNHDNKKNKYSTLSSLPLVVVMGDMNTLSPLDNSMLQNTIIENKTLLQALSSMPCYVAMKKKFLKSPEFHEFNYVPMQHLLNIDLVDTSDLRLPTEPTNIPCDQARYCPCPHLRLDYMLVSKQFLSFPIIPVSHVIINNQTTKLSDHFPIELTLTL